jgi:hypothetical protein
MRITWIARGAGEVLLAAPLFLFAPLYRRRHLRWGATAGEVAAPMPGDGLVARPAFRATRAITIDAPPAAVWPWIVQLGFGRAGWYSYDLFDNAARPSAERILDEYQHPAVGDWVPMAATVSETTAFRIAELDPARSLLWTKPSSTWAWTLTPVGNGGTRLVTRLAEAYSWRTAPATALLSLVLCEFGDFPMMRKMLRGIRRRAEAHADARRAAGIGPEPARQPYLRL